MQGGDRHYDFVVVGAGTMGRSTALYLSLQFPQQKIALIQQFQFNHEEGSSHSKTRIIRSAYRNPFYRDLCLFGIKHNWKQLQTMFGYQLIHQQKYLKYVQEDTLHKDHIEVARSSNNIKQLTPQQVKSSFPYSPDIKLGKSVFLDEEAGVILAQKYMQGILNWLKGRNNVDLFEETLVVDMKNTNQGVNLQIQSKNAQIKRITAGKVALTCGRWMSRLVPALKGYLKPVRQIVSYWQMKDHQNYKLGRYQPWSHKKPGFDTYCVPDFQGDGLKYAIHCENDGPEQKLSEKDYVLMKVAELFQSMNKHFKDRFLKLKKLQNCYYTYTTVEREDFLIDWTDQHQNILVVSACSGHGFKFSPIIGKITADLLKSNSSIDLFEQNRYLMRMEYHLGINLQ